MSARELEDVCTRPGRIRHFAKNPSKFRYGTKRDNIHSPTFQRTRFRLSADISGQQQQQQQSQHPRTTTTTTGSACERPPTLTGRPPFVIPGGRWIVGTSLKDGRLQILCWDLQTTPPPPPPSRRLVSNVNLSNHDPPILQPASFYSMAHPCHPWLMFAFGPPQADVGGRTVRFLSLYWNPSGM